MTVPLSGPLHTQHERIVELADGYTDIWGTRTTLSWSSTRGADAEALRGATAAVSASLGLRLSETKTPIAHIDEGFDFVGFRIS
jgi:hypothetical protein